MTSLCLGLRRFAELLNTPQLPYYIRRDSVDKSEPLVMLFVELSFELMASLYIGCHLTSNSSSSTNKAFQPLDSFLVIVRLESNKSSTALFHLLDGSEVDIMAAS